MTYFTPDEFKCNCGCGLDVSDELKLMANKARDIAGVPFRITSGARCLEHNRNSKSRDTSSHIKGLAFDVKFLNSRERFCILYGLILAGFTRIGENDNLEFYHVDIDKDKPQKVKFGY